MTIQYNRLGCVVVTISLHCINMVSICWRSEHWQYYFDYALHFCLFSRWKVFILFIYVIHVVYGKFVESSVRSHIASMKKSEGRAQLKHRIKVWRNSWESRQERSQSAEFVAKPLVVLNKNVLSSLYSVSEVLLKILLKSRLVSSSWTRCRASSRLVSRVYRYPLLIPYVMDPTKPWTSRGRPRGKENMRHILFKASTHDKYMKK